MISIIIPTYNEAKNIKELVFRIKNCLSREYELIIVDDASPDGTGKIAEELSNNHPIKVIHRKARLGLASAVLDGFKEVSGDLLGVIDSDLSHPPEIIPLLVENLEKQNADIIIGSRFIKDSGIENWPKKRLLATNLATLVVRPLTNISDPMAGFFILRRSVIHNVGLVPRGYKILLEILVKGRYKKAVEFPIVFKDRINGSSKLNLKIYLEFIVQLGTLYFYKIRKSLRKTNANS
ncbi:MAG: polyprenol monophosphomannose synthase [Candidatus Omnitrophica bacterium]|nr:polyprenol monophosphomannose synthase [Candidatus Omnitrophota bacterium]